MISEKNESALKMISMKVMIGLLDFPMRKLVISLQITSVLDSWLNI